jgi:hypothetical protein
MGYLVCVGVEANNRRDYEVVCSLLSSEVELHVIPDAPEARAADMEPVYLGREGYIQASELWKAAFENFRWELRQLVDAGGDRIAGRSDLVARGVSSGVDTRWSQYYVWQFERGLLRRQWALSTEAAMRALLEVPVGAAATDPSA